jgi:hypothetical protein
MYTVKVLVGAAEVCCGVEFADSVKVLFYPFFDVSVVYTDIL